MNMFKNVKPHLWIIDPRVSANRRSRLCRLEFEEIIDELICSIKTYSIRWENNKNTIGPFVRKSLRRYYVTFEVSNIALDAFHNGAGGYRAQYYQGKNIGHQANAYACKCFYDFITKEEASSNNGWKLSDHSRSLKSANSKLWIHQGVWFRRKRLVDRNLSIERWKRIGVTMPQQLERRIWATLTPENERLLKLKGGWIEKTTGKLLRISSKPNRSENLFRDGYT